MGKIILAASVVAITALFGGVAWAEVFEGTNGVDNYSGTSDPDRVALRGGDDDAFGRGGADKISLGTGADRGFGEDSRDKIYGHAGDDLIVGGPGEDELFGADGDDTIYTGTLDGGDKESDEVSCGAGTDTVHLSGQDHAAHNINASCENVTNY